MLQGVIVLPCYTLKRAKISNDPDVKRFLCDLSRFSYIFSMNWLYVSIALVTLDRLWAVRGATTNSYHTNATKRCILRLAIAACVCTFLLCLVPFIPHGNKKCWYEPQTEWVISTFIGITLTVFIFILVSYPYILIKTIRVSFKTTRVQISDGAEPSTSSPIKYEKRKFSYNLLNLSEEQRRMAKIATLIAVGYFLCNGPSMIYHLLRHICQAACLNNLVDGSPEEETAGYTTKVLTFTNGILSPLIYCILDRRNFRSLRSSCSIHMGRGERGQEKGESSNGAIPVTSI